MTLLGLVSLLLLSQMFVDKIGGTCQFPQDLWGTWRGQDGRELTFTQDELRGFRLTVPYLSQSDFMCISSSTDGQISKYILKSEETIQVFGFRPDMYMCLEIDDGFFKYYSIDTSMSIYLQDRLYGIANGAVPLDSTVCNVVNADKIGIIEVNQNVPKDTRDTQSSQQPIARFLHLLRQEMERRRRNK